MNTYKAIRWGWKCFTFKLPYVPFNIQYENRFFYESTNKLFDVQGSTLISLVDNYILIKYINEPHMGIRAQLDRPPRFRIELNPKDNELFLMDMQFLQDVCFILNFEDETDWDTLSNLDPMIRI